MKENNLLVVDIGNHSIDGFINGKPFSLDNRYRWTGSPTPGLMRGATSPFQGFAIHGCPSPSQGQFVFSNAASGGENSADGDKVTTYLPVVLGCCAGIKNTASWEIVVNHWDLNREQEIINLLKGQFEPIVNGRSYNINIEKVVFIPEGFGAMHDIRTDETKNGVLAVVDIGFNTIGFSVFDELNNLLCREYIENSGVRKVVESLQSDTFLNGELSSRPSTDGINAALKNGGFYPSQNSANGQIDISSQIKQIVARWLSATLQSLGRRHREQFSQVENLAFVGGGSNLLKGSVPKGAFIVDDPQWANARGMLVNAQTIN